MQALDCMDYIAGIKNVIQARVASQLHFNGQLLGSWPLKMANFLATGQHCVCPMAWLKL